MPFTFFLDDSDRMRNPDDPRMFGSGIFGMGGLIVPTSEMCALENDIEALSMETFGERVELKWNMPRALNAKLKRGKTQSGCRETMFELLAGHGCESVVTLIYDVRREKSEVGREKMRAFAFEPCLQRFQNHVDRLNDRGPHVVVVDTPPDGPKHLHGVYADVYRNAAELPSGRRVKSGKKCGFASALQISDATHCLALQAADMAVGSVVSWAKAEMTNLRHPDSDPKALVFGRTHMAQWLNVARKGPGSKVLGYGLVAWPRDANYLTVAMEVGLAALI